MKILSPISLKAVLFLLNIVCGYNTYANTYYYLTPVLVETKINKPQYQLKVLPHSTYFVTKEINLHGQKVVLPKGVTLKFNKGFFTNGELIGDDTKITGKCSNIFDRVTISGTWNIKEISTKMFRDLSYENALRDVLALSNPSMHNIITIERVNMWPK